MSRTGFIVKATDGGGADLGDLLVRKEIFGDGSLWLWGYNSTAQLGDSTRTNRSSPVQTISGGTTWEQVSGGSGISAAIKMDGTLWLWGNNANGQLGDSTRTNRSSPVQTISAGTNWKQVSCGNGCTAAIKTDNTLWCWGLNGSGQLGDNTITNRSSPVQTVAGGSNWKQVACGDAHIAAIKTDGTLWNWGGNSYGNLGDNSTTNTSSPVQTVTGGANWRQVSANYYVTSAIKTDGTLWGWGYNAYGQLADNTRTDRSSPIQTISAGTNWKQVDSGYHHTITIKTNGTLWGFGRNDYGQLGDNAAVGKSSPVQIVASGTNWKYVSAGKYHTSAIKTDGTLWACGYNGYGQLGDSTLTNRSSPVQTISGGNTWKQIRCGDLHTLSILDITWQ